MEKKLSVAEQMRKARNIRDIKTHNRLASQLKRAEKRAQVWCREKRIFIS